MVDDRYWQKYFLLFARYLKCTVFFAFVIKICNKCYCHPNIFFQNLSMGMKNAEFYADFKFVDAVKKVISKNHEKRKYSKFA
jgi:hypothetical protein